MSLVNAMWHLNVPFYIAALNLVVWVSVVAWRSERSAP